MALLVLPTVHSTVGAVAYLLLFGIGTVLGMTAITGLLSLPFTVRVPGLERWRRGLALVTGTLSVALGLYMASGIALVERVVMGPLAGMLR